MINKQYKLSGFQKGTRPEKIVRRILTDLGYSYRLNKKTLPGKPDIVFEQYKKIIFVHGCFWHRHACKASVIPKKNTAAWIKRLQYNQMRDFFVLSQLVLLGYDLLILWECEVKELPRDSISRLLISFIHSEENYQFINIKEKEQYGCK